MKILFYKNKRAMTLIEIMCVLVIISIVTSITLPSINNFRSSERCKAEASIFVSYVRQAKYQAIQENTLNRIIFNKDGDTYDGNTFKVQVYSGSSVSSFDDIITSNAEGINDYDSLDWESIADTDEIELDSSVEVDISELIVKDTRKDKNIIYFKPDGYIYRRIKGSKSVDDTADTTDIAAYVPEEKIIFKYGSSGLAVNINALGVISSEAIADEEDDYYSDDYDPDDDNESNYPGLD